MQRFFRISALIVGMAAPMLCSNAVAGGLAPVIPEAQARYSPTQGCVEPTDEMRRNHMDYILHERDETVHEGVRGSRHSLAKCINCHVPPAFGGKKVRADNKEHFCSSCHTYAAVHIDCFQCHTDQPSKEKRRFGGFDPDTSPISLSQGLAVPQRNLLVEDSQP